MKTKLLPLLLFTVGFLTSCNGSLKSPDSSISNNSKKMITDTSKLDSAYLAGGCFWCLDAVYRQMEGVVDVISAYSNGTVENPSYEQVCSGTTGHAEIVNIVFDTSKTSYSEILEVFWRIHNPTTLNRQGNDIGTQYRSGIYYTNEKEKEIALKSKMAVEEAGLWEGKIVTEIEMLHHYFPAEDYHQDYYANNPNNSYCTYVVGEKVAKFKKLFAEKLKQ